MKNTGSPVIPAAPAASGSSKKSLPRETELAPPDLQPQELKIEDAPARRMGFAIVGLGKLALEEIMPAFGECEHAKAVALVSGHPEKAARVAAAHQISEGSVYDYENFDRIADDPAIDIVYIVLPNSMHAEFTIRALKAGKHVLCEKPMAVSVEEGQAMARAGREAGKKLGIAYRLHYEPLNLKVMKWCQEGKFGRIRSFTSSNCQTVEAPNIRLSHALGGGPVGDTGIYSINAARYCIGEEPVSVTAVAHFPDDDPRFKEVPESVSFILTYPSGAIATCDTSFGTIEARRYQVLCDKGSIEMDPAFSYRGLKLKTKELLEEDESSDISEINLRQKNHFAAQMDGFCRAIIDDTEVVTPASMGIADLRIIAAIQESYETGKMVKIDS
ncbi:MAG: Gfo/Idh/MocA family oxidoreductase [Verrucomicrobiota bacterium]